MAKAELAITVEDAGPSPVGQPAPPGVSAPPVAPQPSGAPAPQATETARKQKDAENTIQELFRVVARLGFLGEYVRAIEVIGQAVQRLGQERSTRQAPDTVTNRATAEVKAPQIDRVSDSLFALRQAADSASAALRKVAGTSGPPPLPTGQRQPPLPGPVGQPQEQEGPPAGSAQAATRGVAGLGRAAVTATLAIGGVVLLGVAAKKSADALDNQARDLARFSSDLARSSAMADIRRMRAEIDRARTLGPELSRFQDAWSKLETAIYKIGTQIEEAFLKFVTPIVEWLAKIPTLIENLDDIIAAHADRIIGTLTFNQDKVDEANKELAAIWKRIENANRKDPLADDPFFNEFFESGGWGPLNKAVEMRRGAAKKAEKFPDLNDVRGLGLIPGIAGGV